MSEKLFEKIVLGSFCALLSFSVYACDLFKAPYSPQGVNELYAISVDEQLYDELLKKEIDIENIKNLLKKKANIHWRAKNNSSSLAVALAGHSQEIVFILLSYAQAKDLVSVTEFHYPRPKWKKPELTFFEKVISYFEKEESEWSFWIEEARRYRFTQEKPKQKKKAISNRFRPSLF